MEKFNNYLKLSERGNEKISFYKEILIKITDINIKERLIDTISFKELLIKFKK